MEEQRLGFQFRGLGFRSTFGNREVVRWSAEAGGSRGGGAWRWLTVGDCEQGLGKFAHSGLGFLVRCLLLSFGMNEKGKERQKGKENTKGSG